MSRDNYVAAPDGTVASHTPEPYDCARVTVLFVEDSRECATAFRRALGVHGINVIVAEDVARGRRVLRDLSSSIDAVLLDLHLPDGRGEDLLPDIEAISPQPGVVILSAFLEDIDPDAITYRFVSAPKTIPPARLALILCRAARGYAQSILSRFVKQFVLTSKEFEVLDFIAKGASPKEAATAFACSMQAIYAHLGRICLKTGCSSYPEVVAKLFQFSCHGLGHGMYAGPLP